MDVETGLVNMKGRLYDPRIARFMQADPIMQAPFWSQGLNRYSYVFNNPLQWVDPSGFNADDGKADSDAEIDQAIQDNIAAGDEPYGYEFGVDTITAGAQTEDTIIGQSGDETPDGSGDATGESAQAGDDPEADLEPAPGDEGFGDIFAGDEPVAERGLGSVNPASAGGNVGPANSLFQFIHSMSEFFEMVDRVETARSFTPAGDMMTLADPDAPLDDKLIAGGGIVLMGLSELRAARGLARGLPGALKCFGSCGGFADALQKGLQNAGVKGTRIDISVGKGITPFSNKFGALAERGRGHSAIRVGDMVFDNFRPDGVSYAEFIDDLGGSQFFGTSFVNVVETAF